MLSKSVIHKCCGLLSGVTPVRRRSSALKPGPGEGDSDVRTGSMTIADRQGNTVLYVSLLSLLFPSFPFFYPLSPSSQVTKPTHFKSVGDEGCDIKKDNEGNCKKPRDCSVCARLVVLWSRGSTIRGAWPSVVKQRLGRLEREMFSPQWLGLLWLSQRPSEPTLF